MVKSLFSMLKAPGSIASKEERNKGREGEVERGGREETALNSHFIDMKVNVQNPDLFFS